MQKDVETRIKRIIKENSKMAITDQDIKEESDFIKDFGFDSISVLKLIVAIETEFNIAIDDTYLDLNIIGKYGTLKDYLLKEKL